MSPRGRPSCANASCGFSQRLLAGVQCCTFVVGPLGTILNPAQEVSYVEDTYRYLLNDLLPGNAYYLPGVFAFNPYQSVNGSIWTLPYELRCYVVVMICGRLRLFRLTRLHRSTAVTLQSANLATTVGTGHAMASWTDNSGWAAS